MKSGLRCSVNARGTLCLTIVAVTFTSPLLIFTSSGIMESTMGALVKNVSILLLDCTSFCLLYMAFGGYVTFDVPSFLVATKLFHPASGAPEVVISCSFTNKRPFLLSLTVEACEVSGSTIIGTSQFADLSLCPHLLLI